MTEDGFREEPCLAPRKSALSAERVGFFFPESALKSNTVGFFLLKYGPSAEDVGFLVLKCGPSAEKVGFFQRKCEVRRPSAPALSSIARSALRPAIWEAS